MQRKRKWLNFDLQILPGKFAHFIFISTEWNRSTAQRSLLNLIFRLKRKLFSDEISSLIVANSILTLKQKLQVPTLICLIKSRCNIFINFLNNLILYRNWYCFFMILKFRLIHDKVLLKILWVLSWGLYVVTSEFQVFKVW